MQRHLHITANGSHTIAVQDMGVKYHSRFGAMQESRHIFIEAGFAPLLALHNTLYIFEMGFSTGVNALLSLQAVWRASTKILYQTTELFPLQPEEYAALNYTSLLNDKSLQAYFKLMHTGELNKELTIHPQFILRKMNKPLQDFVSDTLFHLIYFDAFDPETQPELWTQPVFEKMHRMLQGEGVLITYCCKGTVRRVMQAAGFRTEKLKGPPGKREFILAVK